MNIENEIKKLVKKELKNAESKFGKFNSAHEGYAVILEEKEELWQQCKNLDTISYLWESIKQNDEPNQRAWITGLRQTSIKLIEEAIQVSAMIHRFEKDLLTKPD